LEKYSNENDYAARLKQLIDELRASKDKVKELEEVRKKNEKTSK
jgi:hypothetical protein